MSIPKLRDAIDRIDTHLVRLLNRRLRVAQRIGRLKQQTGNHWVDLRRERTILMRLTRRNRGPLTAAALRAIYRQIFLTTRAAQRRVPTARGRR